MKEIPTSAKIAFTCLLGAIVGIFLVSTIVVHAQTVEYVGWSDRTYVGTTLFVGNNLTWGQLEKVGDFINATTTVDEVTVYLSKTNSPSGTLTGYFITGFSTTTNTYTVLATSTNSFASSSITTSITEKVFSFPETEINNDTWFLLLSDATTTASNIRYNVSFYGGSSWGMLKATSYVNGTGMAMGRYRTTGAQCETGGTMSCDMASTTEAIYAVGNVNVLLWAIALVLIFGFFGFRFTQGYIAGKK